MFIVGHLDILYVAIGSDTIIVIDRLFLSMTKCGINGTQAKMRGKYKIRKKYEPSM